VTRSRIVRTGLKPVRHLSLIVGAVAALAAAPLSFPAAAEARTAQVSSGQGIDDFYDSRHGRPLWLQAGQPSIAAQQLLALIDTASADGLDERKYKAKSLAKALRSASKGKERDIRRADEMLSRAFVDYATDLKNAPAAGMKFVDPRLRPGPPSPRALLLQAASASSLAQFIRDMEWMNRSYAPLRRALVAGNYSNNRQRDLLRINMERARVLPATMPRFVIVNAAAQRLHMYERGREVDSMRVVVGKEKDKDRTPMLASFLDHADLNPYWNVPADLAAERIAPNVLKHGLSYLERQGYQLLSDWGEEAKLIDPATIDWEAVAEGRIQVRVRQLPGRANALGKVKFSFPNDYGVYLHDTPDKHLLTEETRLFSGGCIRLEDADRFGEWLFGRTLKAQSKKPEIEVSLESPVPIYVTYLTAVPSGSTITYFDDVYGWDAQRLAEMGSSARVAAR
jgi:L,D-transpeptidase YcbB